MSMRRLWILLSLVSMAVFVGCLNAQVRKKTSTNFQPSENLGATVTAPVPVYSDSMLADMVNRLHSEVDKPKATVQSPADGKADFFKSLGGSSCGGLLSSIKDFFANMLAKFCKPKK